MRRKGFAFACPYPASSMDSIFQRFVGTAENEPSKIYNPWPQITNSDNFNQAWMNPLVRYSYLPTSNPNVYPFNLEQFVTIKHEWAHAQYDVTPAKLLARYYLLVAYRYILLLFRLESWVEEVWDKIDEMNARLSAICEAITLSEELLAIAYSFEDRSFSSEDLNKLEDLEKKSVEKYHYLSSDFETLYYETFKKVARWSREDYDLLMPLLGIFLQGIQPNRYKHDVEVVDSEGRCEILAEVAKHKKNSEELQYWIGEFMTPKHDEIVMMLSNLAELVEFRESSEPGLWLWTLMQGRKPRRGASDIVEVARRNIISVSSPKRVQRLQITLFPREWDGGWFIIPSISKYFRKSSRSQEVAAMNLLKLESLRQQLDEKKVSTVRGISQVCVCV